MSLGFLPDLPSLTIPGLSDVGGILNNVPGLSNLSSILGGDTSQQPPILTQLPKAQQALQTKYSDPSFTGALGALPPSIANAFTNYDQARVAKGQMPLTAPQTFGALQTAATNVPSTPPPHQNFLQNAVSDIGSLVSSIPMLPVNLIKEAEALPQAPQKLSEALGAGSIPGILQGLAQVPGLRMVPGVNTAAQLFNDPGQLLQHPVFTALDVLPYAEPAAGALTENLFSRLPSVEAARQAAADTGSLAAENAARLDAGLQPRPEPSAFRIAAQQSPMVQAFGNTAVGQFLRSTFGGDARDVSQITSGLTNDRSLSTPEIQNALDFSNKWASQVPEARRIELTNAVQLDRNSVLDDPTVTDAERGMVNEYIDHVDQLANYKIQQGSLVNYGGEVYTPQDAARLNRAQTGLDRYTAVNGVRNMVASATPAAADTILPQLDPSIIVNESLRRPEAIQVAQGMAHTADAIGLDAQPLYDAVTAAKRDRNVPMSDVRNVFDQTLANPTADVTNTMPVTDIHQQLAPYVTRAGVEGTQNLPARVRGFIERGDYQGALEDMRQINNRSTYVVPNSQQMLDSLIRQRDAQQFIDRTASYSDRAVRQLQRSQDALQAMRPAARWLPTIEQGVKEQLLNRYMDDPAAQQLVHDHLYSQLPDLGQTELAKLYREQAQGIDFLRDQGTNPVYVHQVSPSKVPALGKPSLSDVIRTPGSVRQRTFDATPYVHDLTVAMSDEAMGLLRERSSRAMVDTIKNLYGIPRSELEQRYLPQARAAAEAQPGLGVDAHLENIIKKSAAKYDPEGIFGHQAGRLTTLTGGEDTYLPLHVDKTLRQLFHDYNNNTVSKLFDPIMKVYRTAIIPLSVRSLMHHMIGGAFQIAGESDPTFIIRQWQAAKDLIDSGAYRDIKGMPPSGLGEAPAPDTIVSWAKQATKSDQIAAVHQMAAGRWLRENVWNRIAPARDTGGNIIDRISTVRQQMDDRLRAMGYLEGKQRALKLDPTLTDEQATQAGVALVRKSMQNWDRMTPMERQTIRMVLPFYGQMNQMLRYAFRYPMDHPFRVGVLDNFARNEVNDFGQALPSNLMDALFLGNPDPKTGTVNTLNLGQLNPFRDLPGYFTMAGWTGASNPVIQSVLRAVGVDPSKGAPSLYPDVAYDPTTGQLRPDNPALLSSFLTDTIPQTQIISAMIGRNDQFKQILKANPDAAAAMMQSSLGLPNLTQNINPTVEATKAEVARQTLQDQVKNQALSSGDWSKAQQYPGLAPFFNQLGQVLQQNPQALSAYQAQVQQGQQNPNSSALTPGAA